MTLLQRYILAQLLKVFSTNLIAFTVLLVFVGAFRDAREKGLGPAQLLQILPYTVPSLLPYTMPATLLLTVCLVYGRMAGDRELTAAKAAGINVLSLLYPAFIFGAVLSTGSLLLNDQVTPWAIKTVQRLVASQMEEIFLDVLKSQHHVTLNSTGLAITVMGVDGKKLVQPTFRYTPRGRDPLMIQASEATLKFDLEQEQIILDLVDGHIDMPEQRRVWFATERRSIPLPNPSRQFKPLELSVTEIRKELQLDDTRKREFKDRQAIEVAWAFALGEFDRLVDGSLSNPALDESTIQRRRQKLRTELHSRFALSTSCFFFVLLGCPVSLLQARREFLTNFFLCFAPILVIYYPAVLLLISLSKNGTVNPAWAVWVGNVILACVSASLLRRVIRH